VFNIEHYLFNKRLPCNFKKFRTFLWSLLHGVTLWYIWIERKIHCSQWNSWHEGRLAKVMWERLLDYGKPEWQYMLQKNQTT
jgi:hypothetical protein